MSLSDELQRLAELRDRGTLSEAEFERAKARLLDGSTQPALPPAGGPLRRSLADRWVGGVCGGLARLGGVESWIVRLAFAALFLFAGTGLLIYILLWIFVPEEE
ncbi:MAG: PspC domain-containing protein [Aquabacterium sp.]|nr:MAG: PspC domain-containing protein [Aquabacterium sp.]